MMKNTFNKNDPNKKKGYILLLTVLIISIILSVAFGVFTIGLKEIVLASFLKNSSVAFSAADRAAECVLYWDRAPQAVSGLEYTIFSTSSAYTPPPSANSAVCDATRLNNAVQTGWSVANTPTSGVTTFNMAYGDKTCADVTVTKLNDITTEIVANGYNSCDSADPNRTQRTLFISSNF